MTEQLAAWIDGTTGTSSISGSGNHVERLAQTDLSRQKSLTGERNHVVIDLDDEMDRSGYGQTAMRPDTPRQNQ